MRFDREQAGGYSLVERAVLNKLGLERLSFTPTAPRERIVPEREGRQALMCRDQEERLGERHAALGGFAGKLPS